ncbi:MAG: DUF115 domain-containing protein [Ruminococcus sp.]|nr:DUF115 domain-containing protein [Ruminococcus sp.]
MLTLKKIYMPLWLGIRNIIIKLGLYNFAHKVYGQVVGIMEMPKMRQAEKRRNGWVDKRYIKLKEFEGIHEGERCFIVCTGPSLTIDDVNMLKDEYTFAMNSGFKLYNKTDWRASYYVVADKMAFNSLSKNQNFNNINNRFISDEIANQAISNEKDIVVPSSVSDFLKYGYPLKFSDDVYSIMYNGGTIVFNILQIAVYMGFKEVYLIGCDCNYSGENRHSAAVEYKEEISVHNIENAMIKTYKVAQSYCESHENFKIYNATRGGMLEVFPRVDFDSLFEDKKQ